jgi:hypothetical protein
MSQFLGTARGLLNRCQTLLIFEPKQGRRMAGGSSQVRLCRQLLSGALRPASNQVSEK